MTYINRDTLLEIIADKNRNTCNGSMTCLQIKRMVEKLPTADVAPKNNEYKMFSSKEEYEAYRIKILKRDLAREIFEEIDKLHLHVTNEFDLRRYNELKMKYTEEKHEDWKISFDL